MSLGDWLEGIGLSEDTANEAEAAAIGIPVIGSWLTMGSDRDLKNTNVVKALDSTFEPVTSSLEWTMSKLNWLYSNGVSQPLSTAMLIAQQEDASAAFSADQWSKAWKTAENVSPGQVFAARYQGEESLFNDPSDLLFGNRGGAAEDIMDARLIRHAPEMFTRMDGWENLSAAERQQVLKDAGIPATVNAKVAEYQRDKAFYNYASGAVDFGLRWYADPTILAGKGIGAARQKVYVKPRPLGGWSRSEIDGLMQSSNMTKAREWIWRNRHDPATINNLPMFRKSAIGPRAGGIVAALKSPDEVDLFLQAAMGDVKARVLLEQANSAAAYRIQTDLARLPQLELAASRVAGHNNPAAQTMIQQRMKEVNAQLRSDRDLVKRYEGALAHYAELDAINLSSRSMRAAERRTAAQMDYRAGPAVNMLRQDGINSPLMMIRSISAPHPNGRIAVDDISKEAADELRGHIARIPGLKNGERRDLMNRYLATTTEGQRLEVLDEVGQLGAAKVAEKHGLSAEDGLAIYNENRKRLAIEQSAMNEKRYSAAYSDRTDSAGHRLRVDAFETAEGKIVVHPVLATQLANDHVLMDLAEMDRVIGRNVGALKALKARGGTMTDAMVDMADGFNRLWKFSVLFRLGYIPRVLADDISGQIARLGAAAMVGRATKGFNNTLMNTMMYASAKSKAGLLQPSRSFYEARAATAAQGVRYADEDLRILRPQAAQLERRAGHAVEMARRARVRANTRLRKAENKLRYMPPTATAAQTRAQQRLVDKHRDAVDAAQRQMDAVESSPGMIRLNTLRDQIRGLEADRALIQQRAEKAKRYATREFTRKTQLNRRPEGRGVRLPAAFSGESGEYFQKIISSDDSLRNLLESQKRLMHGNLQLSMSSAGKTLDYHQNPEKFVRSWDKAINHVIMQDQLAAMAAKGATVEQMAKWLKGDPKGIAYRDRFGVKYIEEEQIAANAWHMVDQYLPTWEIRQAALKGEADQEFLTAAARNGRRPAEIHTTELGEALAGTNTAARTFDRIWDAWFKVAAAMPADRMSRHPLFNQLYEGHAKILLDQEFKQIRELSAAGGVRRQATMDRKDVERVATTARRLALNDTRKLVFDIAHRSDAAAALRFISPFFASTSEAFQRWARIIADKPQVVGYAGNFYNGPASMGLVQDMDGNPVGADGYSVDPVTGERKLVPKNERYIVARVPSFLANSSLGKALGMKDYNEKPVMISQNSAYIVTQGDPWFNPGTGPLVAMPVNEFVKDKPEAAEVARHLGVLPFGPQVEGPLGDGPLGRASAVATPQVIKNFLTAFDTTDSRYQRIKLHIMQKATYEHAELGKPMPSKEEIADRVRNYWLESAAWSFIQPAATRRTDKYEFYRQQYRKLRREDFRNADQRFIDAYGESFFTFAASTSDTSIPPTKKAVKLFKEYGDLIATNPELSKLIIGSDGDGPFSREAWAYSLTTPLVPGDTEMITRRLSAEEAMEENERRKGWAEYTRLINWVTAQMQQAGFDSFSDEGAERFEQMRSMVADLLSTPTLPDGSRNGMYNEAWAQEFYTLDPKKYERLIPDLEKVAYSRLADNPNRTDLRTLQTYLEARGAIQELLAQRQAAGGAKTLGAQANSDLARAWAVFVDHLIEQDTRFGDLHSRYLARDMGLDVAEMIEEETV